MKKYKICVYAICKNEERFVDRWMDAVSEADLVVVADTGSTDNTVGKLRARGAEVYVDIIEPWRFDAARNAALGHVPEDVDICVSNDLDEVFEAGWREKLENAWQPGHTRARYLFTSNSNSDGSPLKQFAMEKIHRRHGFRWVHPVHEILEYSGEDKDNIVWVRGLVLNHCPDTAKSRKQYLPLLELSVRENPDNDRAVFWLGREYLYYRMFDRCIDTLSRYLEMPSAVWNEERCAAMRFIASCLQEKGDGNGAKMWLFKAIAECPGVREPYHQAARLGYLQNDWPLVFFMVDKALRITERSGSYLLDTEAWGYSLYDLGAISCYRLGLFGRACDYAVRACELQPENARLKRNLELIRLKLQ